MRALVFMRLDKVKARDKLAPLAKSDYLDQIVLIRHASVDLSTPKIHEIIHDIGHNPGYLNDSLLRSICNVWASLFSGLKASKTYAPTIIIGYFLMPYGIIAWLVARVRQRPIIICLLGTDLDRHVKAKYYGLFLRLILKNCDAICVVGERQRGELIDYGIAPQKVFILPNTINSDLHKPDPSVTPDSDLIYVGHLIKLKRVDLLLRTLRKIHETRPQSNLLIVGDGPERTALEALADSLGIRDAVTFSGWSDHVLEHLLHARVFVLLSEREGLPAAMLEAMCTGLPAIMSDVGAISSVVQHGENGYLIPTSAGPDEIAPLILQVLDDNELYQKFSNSATGVRQTHGYEKSSAVWGHILRTVVAKEQS